MVVTPWVLGLAWAIGQGRFEPAHVVLFGFWMVGYFAFYAAGLWLKSRFRPRYRSAVLTYGSVSAVLGVVVLLLAPQWWSWVLVYVPICAFALWLSYQRRERDVVSGLATLVAACLLPVVMASGGITRIDGMPTLGVLAAICFGYFFGTVWYVKTVIRERGKPSWLVLSIAWHAACVVAALFVPAPLPTGWVVAFFVLLLLRAVLVAWLGPMSGRRPKVSILGIGEFVLTVILLLILVPTLVA